MNQHAFVVQPVATLTNIPLIILGVFFAIKYIKDTALYTLSLLLLATALGSVIIHMTFTRFGQMLDFSGIAFVFLWVGFYYTLKPERLKIVYPIIMPIIYVIIFYNEKARYPIVLLSAFFSVSSLIHFERLKSILTNKHLILSFLSFTFGFTLFYIDNKKIWCPQNLWLMGHSLWHLILSFSFYNLFQFFKEKQLQQDQTLQ